MLDHTYVHTAHADTCAYAQSVHWEHFCNRFVTEWTPKLLGTKFVKAILLHTVWYFATLPQVVGVNPLEPIKKCVNLWQMDIKFIFGVNYSWNWFTHNICRLCWPQTCVVAYCGYMLATGQVYRCVYVQTFANYTAWKWRLEKKNHDWAPKLAAYASTTRATIVATILHLQLPYIRLQAGHRP